jgi:dienelactone hydrolase
MKLARFLPAFALLAALRVDAQAMQGSERVEFEVRTATGGAEKIFAHLFRPAGAASKSPAIVIVHGSGGVSTAREGFWARELSAVGLVTLVTDSFAPRGVSSTAEDQSRVSTFQMLHDAYGALDFLATHDFVDEKRIAVMGMSKGGTVALLAADARTHRGRAFAAYLPLYPSCTVQFREPRVAAPMLMLIGGSDNYTGTRTCADYVARIRAAGGQATLKVYPGAHHGFDGDTSNEREFYVAAAENYRDCVLYYEDDGSFVDAKSGKAIAAQEIMPFMRRSCVRRGATVAANFRVKMQALEDVRGFLRTTLLH